MCYLKAVLEQTGKLFPLHLVVVYPGPNGNLRILRAWDAICHMKRESLVIKTRYVKLRVKFKMISKTLLFLFN